MICAGAAAYLCYKGIDGWGWFLFAAIVLYPDGVARLFGNDS